MSIREEMLEVASQIISTDRNVDYGEPAKNFEQIAVMWTAYFGAVFQPHDVAAMMALLKVARISTSPEKADHWIDLAGYAACGAEVRPGT